MAATRRGIQAMRSISILEAIEDYRTYNRAQNYSPSYVASTDRNLREFARWLAEEGRSGQLADLTIDEARAFVVYLQERDNRSRPGTRLSPDSVQQYARNLKSWASFLHADGFTNSNLFARLRLPKVPVREPDVLTDDEIARVISIYNPGTATGLRNILLVLVLADSGLRLGELCAATVDDVDLERGTLKVMGKGQRERTVHVGSTVEKLLSRYVRYLRPEPISGRVRSLLLARDGSPFTLNAAKRVLKRAATQSGIKRLHAHLLRHTFATHYLLNGGDLLTLQRLLGHSTLEMVRRYSHIAAGYVAVQHRQYSPVDRVPLRFRRQQTRLHTTPHQRRVLRLAPAATVQGPAERPRVVDRVAVTP
ncbi:MAG: tyrosine-type recombinase/integrase [Chloroflexota bacterium]|nr:tyrosine-type recombinase/integrase [Chloroflexota bacterium]